MLLLLKKKKKSQAIIETPEKLRLLLLKISSSLKADDAKSFYIMLKVMKEHGGKGTQTLADHVMSKLNILSDKSSHICSDAIQNDESKG